MNRIENLKIKIYADGANLEQISELASNPLIAGFTTNPTLIRKAGIRNYKAFALDLLRQVGDKPVSFEVLADDFSLMEREAIEIASWGRNVNVKIPVTNSKGEFSGALIRTLSESQVVVNVTAIMTLEQVRRVVDCLADDNASIVSIFAGRIADTGLDPVPTMVQAIKELRSKEKSALIWASPREVLNVYQADSIGCHIITVNEDILKKFKLIGKDLNEYSLETVRMFYEDAKRLKARLS